MPTALNPILVAEDFEPDAVLVELAFKKAGVLNPFYFVTDGEQTIRYLGGEGIFADRGLFPKPGVIILDLKMPGINGFQVLQWSRVQPEYRETLIIVLSGHNENRDLTKAYQVGANTFLPKPIEQAEVLNVVRAFPGPWVLAHKA
jgi:two-component system response regulator